MERAEKIIKFKSGTIIVFLCSFLFVSVISAYAQAVKVEPKIAIAPKKIKRVVNTDGISAEKSIAVDARVNISLCVSEGRLKVNGWERNEIRVFVNEGSEAGFKVLQKNKQNNNAVWVMVLGFDPAKNKESSPDECLAGEEIELDVPRGATINVKGQSSETTIESVGKVAVENVGGDIFLNNIERGIDAKTYEGDVTVGTSGGAMTLFSTTGNIVVFNVMPSEIGDVFKAKTSSGAISLKNVEHRQMEINSNSGSIKFTGEFQTGGQYTLGTSNGSISLIIPEKTSCKITALFGLGLFNSELPLHNINKSVAPKTQSLTALLGSGDATLNLTTYSGAIRIRKQ